VFFSSWKGSEGYVLGVFMVMARFASFDSDEKVW